MSDGELIDIKLMAKDRYMSGNYTSIKDLGNELHIPVDTIKKWVYYGNKDEKAWKLIREEEQSHELREVIRNSYIKDRALKEKMTDLGLKVASKIEIGLEAGLYKPEDHAKLLNALSTFKRVSDSGLRLDEGRSTSNVEVRPAKEDSMFDLVKKAEKNDPFAEGELVNEQ